MYRNDGGRFDDVAAEIGLNDVAESRAAAWGDYDGDGHLDLFVGFARGTTSKNRLYRNEGNGKRFTDVAPTLGLDLVGTTRQVTWVDFDNDGDVDLFIAFRDLPNVLMRNDGGRFTDISKELGIDDPRKTVGAVWFDFDEDGDLDLFVANMDGTANALFRNEGTHFEDRAAELGLAGGGRPLGQAEYGSVRACVVDFDTDGDLDLFVANYGPNALYRNEGGGNFVNVAPEMGLAIDSRYDSCAWGDYDNDGRPDLYANGTVSRLLNYRDYLFHNQGDFFVNVTPPIVLHQESDHGVQWADVDGDGDLDLAITGANHYLLLNLLRPDRARRSMQVLVTMPKATIRAPARRCAFMDRGTASYWAPE